MSWCWHWNWINWIYCFHLKTVKNLLSLHNQNSFQVTMSLTQDEEIPSESPLSQLAQQPTNDINSSQQDQPSQPELQPQSQPDPEPAPEPGPQENSNKPLPRLVLTQIELENFKSYYGRRIIGPFH